MLQICTKIKRNKYWVYKGHIGIGVLAHLKDSPTTNPIVYTSMFG